MFNLFFNIARAEEIVNPLAYGTVAGLINAITSVLQAFAGGIATIMVLVGAFKILTAGGEPKKYEEGKHTIIYAAVGLAIIFLAGGVVSLVSNLLGDAGIQTGTSAPVERHILPVGGAPEMVTVPIPDFDTGPAGEMRPTFGGPANGNNLNDIPVP